MNAKLATIFVLIVSLIISGCGQGQSPELTTTPMQVFEPTMTISPASTITPAVTESPTPVIPHTPNPEAVKLLEEAFSYSRQGEDEKAIETYTKAIEADPIYAQPYINRGAVYADTGEPEKGMTDFDMGLELDPTNVLGYSNRAQAYIALDKPDKALADIKSVLNLTKDDEYKIRALYLGGRVYEIKGETFLALAAYSAALEIDEFFLPALLSRGQIYFQQEDWLRAFSDLVLALETTEDPELRDGMVNILTKVYPEGTTVDDAIAASTLHFDQGMALREKGDYGGSTQSVSKAIEIDPLNADFYFIRGLNLASEGEYEDAITDMSFSIALLPNDPRGYFYRGLMESESGLVNEAIVDMEKALEFDLNSDVEAHAIQVLEDMGQLYKSCQFTEFETVNDAEKPTFLFTFAGPPEEDYSILTLTPGEGGSMFLGIIPADGIASSGTEYSLQQGETTPIEVEINILYKGCHLRKIAVWPEVDILAELSGDNP